MAISKPAIPIHMDPPISRAFPALAISLNLDSVCVGSLPTIEGASRSSTIFLVTVGCLLKHSPMPVRPSSVCTKINGKDRSKIRHSTDVIFIKTSLFVGYCFRD